MWPSKTHSKIHNLKDILHSVREWHHFYELAWLRSPWEPPGSPGLPDASQMSPRCLLDSLFGVSRWGHQYYVKYMRFIWNLCVLNFMWNLCVLCEIYAVYVKSMRFEFYVKSMHFMWNLWVFMWKLCVFMWKVCFWCEIYAFLNGCVTFSEKYGAPVSSRCQLEE